MPASRGAARYLRKCATSLRLRLDKNILTTTRLRVLMVLGVAASLCPACRQQCEIRTGQAGVVRLGASKDEVLKVLVNRYSVVEPAVPGQQTTLIVRAHGAPADQPAFVVGFHAGLVSIIDSYERCATAEGAGPGVTLGRAQQIYGAGRIDPTDIGYFVWFTQKKGTEFLLDQRDIPERLRNIPDDVLSPDNERDILGLTAARITAVRVEAP